MPSTVLGLVLFVALLAPGLAYVLRYEKVVPDPEQSAFRETLRVVFVSVTCLIAAGLLLAGLRWALPAYTLDVRGLIQDPPRFAREHHVQLTWWFLAFIGLATFLGVVAADPRLVRKVRAARAGRLARTLFGETHIGDFSAWREALTELRDRTAHVKGENENDQQTYVGVQMDDGTYIRGFLVSYTPRATEDEQREMILTQADVRTRDGQIHPIGSTLTVISARHIVRLDVTHIAAAQHNVASIQARSPKTAVADSSTSASNSCIEGTGQ